MSQEENDLCNEVMETLKINLKKLITVFIYLSKALGDKHRAFVFEKEGLRIKNGMSLDKKSFEELESLRLEESLADRDFQQIAFCTFLKNQNMWTTCV